MASIITEEEFQRIWNESYFAAEVADKTGYKNSDTVRAKANDLRRRGYALKDMGKNHLEICPTCGSRALLDIRTKNNARVARHRQKERELKL